ncbi:MAG: hypothetical protein LBP83_09300 [Dysgonamonadaceae bacterium]|jgi:16S rRNA C1402 N4-methylase RsmH|nr:hypothetical protein [Dysgonamonadaceae bacterium]
MTFKSEIESCIEQIKELENILQTVYKGLDALKQRLREIEASQLSEQPAVPMVKETGEKVFFSHVSLEDKIIKTMYADLKKSMSLNDRFRFQKDLFENNADLMNKTLDDLNNMSSLQETLDYLNSHFTWDWKNESVKVLKGMLEKRFT